MEPRVDYAFFIATLGGAFAIMNPFVTLPIFLALVGSTLLAIAAGALAFTAVARLTGTEEPEA